MSVLAAIFSATMLAQTLRMSVPYACAALGGVWSERSGVANIALEGGLLVSGLTSVAVAHASGNTSLGVAAAIASGAVFTFAHACLVVKGRVDAIVSGIALNLIALGGTRFLLRALYGSSSNSPTVPGFRIPGISGASGTQLLLRTLIDPLMALAILAAMFSVWSLYKTRFGLRVRAAGEDPQAASTVGVQVDRVRMSAIVIGGAICGIGGAALALDQHQFQAGMSGGRGFIALAAVILSGWRPLRAIAACVVFAAMDALQIVLQDQAKLPPQIVSMLPYVATLISLVLVLRRQRAGETVEGRPPAGLGKHAG